MKALSSRNDEPQRASRPYDVDRDGFVMAKAPALSFWKRWNTPKSAAQKFTGNSSATASPRTPTTSPPRTRKAAAPPAA